MDVTTYQPCSSPLSAKHVYNRFKQFYKITGIGSEIPVVCLKYSTIKQILVFQPLEIVGRGSETQLQVGEKLD